MGLGNQVSSCNGTLIDGACLTGAIPILAAAGVSPYPVDTGYQGNGCKNQKERFNRCTVAHVPEEDDGVDQEVCDCQMQQPARMACPQEPPKRWEERQRRQHEH